MTRVSALLFAAAAAAAVAAPAPAVDISVGPTAQRDAAALLSIVLPELNAEIAQLLSSTAADGTVPTVVFDLAPEWRAAHVSPAAETHTRRVASHAPLVVHVTARGLLGLAYAVHDLREHLGLWPGARVVAGAAATKESWAVSALLAFASAAPPTPLYATRAWSEEGQLLAIPDRGFYTSDGSAANVSAIAGDAAALEAEIVPALLRLRMNTLVVLHSDVEDYVTYDTLPTFLPGAPAIYGPSDPHRTRREGIVLVMAPWVAHLKDDFGLAFVLQVYELSSPPGVCTPPSGGGKPLLNCSLGSPDVPALLKVRHRLAGCDSNRPTTAFACLQPVIHSIDPPPHRPSPPRMQARYSELAASIPALSGMLVTVEDSWAPRAGYEFSLLWSTQPQLPEVVSMFHDAINATAGLRMMFRLWVFGETIDWPTLAAGSPPGAEFSVKQSQGDFLLDSPLNALLQCNATSGDCPPRDRRMIVEVDAFRQYQAWGSGLCYMGDQWAPRLAEASAAGAADIWGWGSWAPGCTWPDSGPTLINGSTTPGEYKSWRGWWDSYRLFNATPTNGGFSLSGQANAYTLYRLSWSDTQAVGGKGAAAAPNSSTVANDFATLYYGAANAPAMAALLNASMYAWIQTSSPSRINDFSLFWTHMQHDPIPSEFAKLAAGGLTLAEVTAPANASAAAVVLMQEALAAIDPAAVPATNPSGYAGAVRAVGLTAAYLRAYFGWRSAGTAVALLDTPGAAPSPADCATASALVAEAMAAAYAFGDAYPIESATWVVSTLDPALYSAPPFLANTLERTMVGYASPWTGNITRACGGGARQ